jgi:TP901 family phage tail tape measure protein
MAIDAGSIFSEVRIRLDKLGGDLKSVQTSFSKLGRQLVAGSKASTTEIAGNFNQMSLAGTAAFAAIALAAKQAISTFATTEQSLANVEAVTNATAAEFENLENAAKDAGRTTRFTAGQAADALFFLASAGLDAKQSVDALQGVLELAGATNSDLAFTAQTVTAVLSQYSLAADEASRVSNVFAAANSNSQATLEKLAGAFRQVGPVAAGLGISLEDTVGALQLLFNAGFQGQQAGRALKSALADLANQASPTIEKLEALGIAFEDVNPEAVGLEGAIRALETAGLTTAQTLDVFGKVAGPQLSVLISKGGDAIAEYTKAVTGTNEAARQYAVQNDTLAGSFDRFKSATEAAGNSLVETLAPAFRLVLDVVAAVLGFISQLPEELLAIVAGGGGAALAIVGISKALAIFGVTLTASLGPLSLVAAGIGALIALTTTFINEVKKAEEIRFSGLDGIAESAGLAKKEVLALVDVFENMRNNGVELNEAIDRTAKALKVSRDVAEKILLTSTEINDEEKDRIKLIQEQTTEARLLADQQSELPAFVKEEIRLAEERLNQQREEARLAREEEARKKAAEDREDRILKIREGLTRVDRLIREGLITEVAGLELKAKLRKEEIELLRDQALKEGDFSDAVVSGIREQQEAVARYEARIKELESATESLAEKEERLGKLREQNLEAARRESEKNINFLKRQGIDIPISAQGIEILRNQIRDVKKEIGKDGVTIDIEAKISEIITGNLQDLIRGLGSALKSGVDAAKKDVDEIASTISSITESEEERIEALLALEENLASVQQDRASALILEEIERADLFKNSVRDELAVIKDSSAEKIRLSQKEADVAIQAINARLSEEIKRLNKEEQEALKAEGLIERTKLEALRSRLTEELSDEERAEIEKQIRIEEIREEFALKRESAEAKAQDKIIEINDLRLKDAELLAGEILEIEQEINKVREASQAQELTRLKEQKKAADATFLTMGLFEQQLSGFGNSVQSLIESDYLGAAASAIGTLLTPVLQGLGEEIIDNLTPELIGLGEEITETSSKISEKLAPLIITLLEVAAPFLDLLFEVLELFSNFVPLFSLMIKINPLLNTMIGSVRLLTFLLDEVNKFLEFIGENTGPFGDFVSSMVDLIQAITSFDIPGIGEAGGDLLGGVGDFFGDIGSGIGSLFGFQTGGIVMPQGGSGVPIIVAENNAPEMMLNAGSEGRPMMEQFAAMLSGMINNAGGGGNVTVVVQLDADSLAQSTADRINNGTVEIEGL